MANKRVGKRTVNLQNNPTIISAASVVGPKEGQGPLKEYFNLILYEKLSGKNFQLCAIWHKKAGKTRGYKLLLVSNKSKLFHHLLRKEYNFFGI